MEVRGRTVVVTGASSGIGAAASAAMAARGAAVALVARTEHKLDEVAERIRSAGGRALVVPCDLADAAAVATAGARVRAELGIPDVLVNNAGAGRWLFSHETPPDELVDMMASPYFGAFLITRELLPGMLRRGSGRIVNVTSPAGFIAWPGGTGYVVARFAMRGFSEALRADLRRTRIGVSLVVPGEVSSPYFTNNPGTADRMPKIARMFRTLTPEEAAGAIVDAVVRERALVVEPPLLRWSLRLHRVWPWPTDVLAARTGTRIAVPARDEPSDA